MKKNLFYQFPLPTKTKESEAHTHTHTQIDKCSQNVSTEKRIKQLFPKQVVIQLPWLKTAVTSILSYFLF